MGHVLAVLRVFCSFFARFCGSKAQDGGAAPCITKRRNINVAAYRACRKYRIKNGIYQHYRISKRVNGVAAYRVRARHMATSQHERSSNSSSVAALSVAAPWRQRRLACSAASGNGIGRAKRIFHVARQDSISGLPKYQQHQHGAA